MILHPLLFTEDKCRRCYGDGRERSNSGFDEGPCPDCAGSGRVMTELADAIWDLATLAAAAERRSH